MLRLATAFVLISALTLSGALGALDDASGGDAELPPLGWALFTPFSAANSLLVLAALCLLAGRRRLLGRAVAAFAIILAIELVLKLLFPLNAGVGAHELGNSGLYVGFYPSGHVARATFLATLAFLFLGSGRTRSLVYALPLSVAILMVLTGGHFLTDCIGGALLGSTLGLWVMRPLRLAEATPGPSTPTPG